LLVNDNSVMQYFSRKKNYQETDHDSAIGIHETTYDSAMGVKCRSVSLNTRVVQTMYLHWLKLMNSPNSLKAEN